MGSVLKTFRHHAEWIAVSACAFLVPKLPRRVCHSLADAIGALVAFMHVPGRRVALSNLEAAFGAQMGPRERGRVVRRSYQYFARAMADLFWSARLSEAEMERIFDLRGLAELKAERGGAEGMIFACLHYGGFEWIALALGLSGFRCTVVTQAFKNPLLNGTFNRLREISGHQTVRREGAILRLYKALQNNRSVTLAVDLTVSAKLPSVPIDCFGMQTCVTFAHAWLHRRTGAPIIPTYCEPLAGGRYRLVFHPPLQIAPDATAQEVAQACWDCFEPVIRRQPAPWLWMYKHWRYKPASSTRPYPFYAQSWNAFDRMLTDDEPAKTATNDTNAG